MEGGMESGSGEDKLVSLLKASLQGRDFILGQQGATGRFSATSDMVRFVYAESSNSTFVPFGPRHVGLGIGFRVSLSG